MTSTKDNIKEKNTSSSGNKHNKQGNEGNIQKCIICNKEGYFYTKCSQRKYVACSGLYHYFDQCPKFK